VLAAKTIVGAAGLSGPDRYWDRRRAALVAATGHDPPSLGADPLTRIAVGSMAAASVLAVQPPNPDLLSQPAGVLLLVAYAAVSMVGAATAVRRRDVD